MRMLSCHTAEDPVDFPFDIIGLGVDPCLSDWLEDRGTYTQPVSDLSVLLNSISKGRVDVDEQNGRRAACATLLLKIGSAMKIWLPHCKMRLWPT